MNQKLQIFFFLFLLGTIGAKAQPVITAAGNAPQIGESFKITFPTSGSINPPDSGGINKVWDYSNLKDSANTSLY